MRLRVALRGQASVAHAVASDIERRSTLLADTPVEMRSIAELCASVRGLSDRSGASADAIDRVARRFAALDQADSPIWVMVHATTSEFHALVDGPPEDVRAISAPSRGPTLAEMGAAARRTLDAALATAPGSAAPGSAALSARRRRVLTDLDQRLRTHPDLHLLELDLADQGRIVLAHGDLAHADRIAIVVPGIGNNLDRLPVEAPWNTQAARLRDAIGHRTATIEWIDDPSPDSTLWNADEIVTDLHARRAATRLRRFVDQVRRESSAPIAVIGHSYGAVVASTAAARGMACDALFLLGSPGAGVGIHSIDDYRLAPGASVTAGITIDDPIATVAWAGGLGDDPTAPAFGPSISLGAGGHSAYFATNSAALRALAARLLAVTPRVPSRPTAQ